MSTSSDKNVFPLIDMYDSGASDSSIHSVLWIKVNGIDNVVVMQKLRCMIVGSTQPYYPNKDVNPGSRCNECPRMRMVGVPDVCYYLVKGQDVVCRGGIIMS